LRIQFEQAGLVTVEGGVEVELKAERWFPHFRGLEPGQARFRLAGVLPHFIQVDSEDQQELLERDLETSGQTEEFVDARNRSGFYIGQGRVRNIEISVAFEVGN
jgi:hypothetical protein